jgi:hypothetical protein
MSDHKVGSPNDQLDHKEGGGVGNRILNGWGSNESNQKLTLWFSFWAQKLTEYHSFRGQK